MIIRKFIKHDSKGNAVKSLVLHDEVSKKCRYIIGYAIAVSNPWKDSDGNYRKFGCFKMREEQYKERSIVIGKYKFNIVAFN